MAYIFFYSTNIIMSHQFMQKEFITLTLLKYYIKCIYLKYYI